MAPENKSRLGRVQSLVRAFGLLDMLADSQQGLSLIALSKEVALPCSTTHRLLTTMSDLGYAQFDQHSSRWSVGLRAFEVGRTFAHNRDVAKMARPAMQALMLDVREIVNIGIVRDANVQLVDQVKPPTARTMPVAPGQHVPLHMTALGKALIGYQPEGDVYALFDRIRCRSATANSITELPALQWHLRLVRERGYAIDDEECVTGFRCIGAPIFDEYTKPVAAISVSAALSRIPSARIETVGHAVRSVADRITASIGGRKAA